MGANQIAQALGLGAPFAAAAAMYLLFLFLDKKASSEATTAVAAWIQNEKYKRLDLTSAVVSSFDALYGQRLFSFQALFRSASLSIASVLIYHFMLDVSLRTEFRFLAKFVVPLVIVSDYISLFAIKACLIRAKSNQLVLTVLALILASVAISLTVFSFYLWIWLDQMHLIHEPRKLHFILEYVGISFSALPGMFNQVAPALFVHLWLPLFLLAGILNKAINQFFRATGVTQWFLKHGSEHPFEAIGITASVIVFVLAAIIKGTEFVVSLRI
jgi:hypothetical protein